MHKQGVCIAQALGTQCRILAIQQLATIEILKTPKPHSVPKMRCSGDGNYRLPRELRGGLHTDSGDMQNSPMHPQFRSYYLSLTLFGAELQPD